MWANNFGVRIFFYADFLLHKHFMHRRLYALINFIYDHMFAYKFYVRRLLVRIACILSFLCGLMFAEKVYAPHWFLVPSVCIIFHVDVSQRKNFMLATDILCPCRHIFLSKFFSA